jgi:hypothetical protein
MIRFFKSLFGSKKVEEPVVPYKVEAPAQESTPAPAVVVEPGKEVTTDASKPAKKPTAKKQGGNKPVAAKKQGSKAPKPKTPKQPKA